LGQGFFIRLEGQGGLGFGLAGGFAGAPGGFAGQFEFAFGLARHGLGGLGFGRRQRGLFFRHLRNCSQIRCLHKLLLSLSTNDFTFGLHHHRLLPASLGASRENIKEKVKRNGFGLLAAIACAKLAAHETMDRRLS
jgi:hypothetical protein